MTDYETAKATFDAALAALIGVDLTTATSVPRAHALELVRVTVIAQVNAAVDTAQQATIRRPRRPVGAVARGQE